MLYPFYEFFQKVVKKRKKKKKPPSSLSDAPVEQEKVAKDIAIVAEFAELRHLSEK